MQNLLSTRRIDPRAGRPASTPGSKRRPGDTPGDSGDGGPLAAPVFFVGVPRSGTTVFFEAFSKHERLAWLTNYSRRFPTVPALNLLCHLLEGSRWGVYGRKRQYGQVALLNAVLPRPDEAYPFWDKHAGVQFAGDFLRGVRASSVVATRLRSAIAAVVRWQGGQRFATKITGPTRMVFLSSVFPDAYFVHIIRDGRAVVESLLRSPFWVEGGGLHRPWWKGGPSSSATKSASASMTNPAMLAATQWCDVIEVAREEAEMLPAGRYIETRYEDFVEDPHAVVRDLYRQCGLSDSPRAHRYIDQVPLFSEMPTKYRESFSRQEVQGLGAAMQPWLAALGYR